MDSSAVSSVFSLSLDNEDVVVDQQSLTFDDDEESGQSRQGEEEQVAIATVETRQVARLRAMLVLVLAAVAGFVCFAVYRIGRTSEQKGFENYAREACEKVTSSFEASSARRVTAIESLAKSISSNAAAQGLTWPNVTVPDFEERMSLTLDLAQVMSITLLPLVTGEDLDGWTEFSVANQGWFQEGLDYQEETLGTNYAQWQDDIELMEAAMGASPNKTIPEGIFQLGSNSSATAEDGPFLPWWMFAPIFPIHNLVNYDTLTNPSRQYQLKAVLESKEALVSEAWDYSDDENPATFGKKMVLNMFLRQWEEGGKRYQDGPVSDLYYPVFDDSKDQPKVAAILTAYVYWQIYFENVLPPDTEPVLAVLENICGNQDNHDHDSHHGDHEHERHLRVGNSHDHEQQFSYLITGETATYLGPGDLHDQKYDYLGESTGLGAFLAGSTTKEEDLLEGQCVYRVRCFPTQDMHDALSTKEPIAFMLIVLGTFVCTSLVFVMYDYYVEHRQKVVLNKAIKSTEVVNTMFPEKVRDRLFEDSSASPKPSRRRRLSPKQEGTSSTDNNGSMEDIEPGHGGRTKDAMVADLYEDCTVFFADLAGFTKWSSGREPCDIFLLLETLYNGFDRIAKRNHVFKVETIGDCYLAITGVPTPQKNHAVIMTKFAIACMEKMDYLIRTKLVQQLGEATQELKLRVGIHSGSVTAGVLRGDRARFQLFGDTVNVASRMESLSLPGKIQVSAQTARLLVAAMKGDWLTERIGGIEAKGKGTLESYWVTRSQGSSTRASLAASVSTDGYSAESVVSE